MNVNAQIPQQWWERIRWTRHGFFAGLVIGIALGWFFHGLISFFVRFGLVLLLILPLLVIGWFWLRSSRGGRPAEPAGNERRVMTWSSGRFAPDEPFEPFVDVPAGPSRRATRSADREDPYVRAEQPPSRQGGQRPVPSDVENELRELKRQQERGR